MFIWIFLIIIYLDMISLDALRTKRSAVLALQNGRIFYGDGFGATSKITGEVVFTTFTAAGYNPFAGSCFFRGSRSCL